MDQATYGSAQAAAVHFAHRAVLLWQAALGSELLGVYLIGSLAHGGFSARYSDIDMAVITERGISPQVMDHVRGEANAAEAEWGPKLSVFWADRDFEVGRFPPLDRIDLLDHAVVLTEREQARPARPSLAEIRSYLADAPLRNWAESVRRFAVADTLAPKDRKAYLRTILYPGRFCYSWLTGRMGSNHEAVAFLAETPPVGLDVASISRALQCRQADADPDDLFPLRAAWQTQIDACVALVDSPPPQA